MDTNQKVHPSLPPNSYFSPKWLKMLPFAAVHSFNPRQDPVEKQTPTFFSAPFLVLSSRRTLLLSFAVEISNERHTGNGFYRDTPWGKDKRFPGRAVKTQGGISKGSVGTTLWKHPQVSSLWEPDGGVRFRGPEASPRSRTKTPPMGSGVADWSKLSRSKAFALGEHCQRSHPQREIRRQLILSGIRENQSTVQKPWPHAAPPFLG